jgi:hypothetical protein
MKRKYVCIWGSWDENMPNAYDFKVEVQMIGFFNTENGYSADDVLGILATPLKQLWNSPDGNHIVIPVKEVND